MAYNQQSNQRSRQNTSARPGKLNGTLIGAVFLGICILIAGFNIGGNLKKLNATLTDKSFSDSNIYNAPSDISYTQKKYLSETEAAEYLNMNSQEVINLISSGEITQYVKTGTGYSISVDELDKWFGNAAYQNMLNYAGNNLPDDTQ